MEYYDEEILTFIKSNNMKYSQISKCFLKLLSDTSSHSFKNNSYKVTKKTIFIFFYSEQKKVF